MLREVNLPDPETMMTRYPHQLSGGQQQRVVIAMALMAEPSLLVMDEPTTGLDVTVEAAVLDLVARLREKHNTAIVFISHNLGTVVRICDRIGVMYAGELVEEGPITEVFRNPRHPYTRGLLELHPDARRRQEQPAADRRFRARCPRSSTGRRAACSSRAASSRKPERCSQDPLPTLDMSARHRVKCVRANELPEHEKLPQGLEAIALGKAPVDAEVVLQIAHLRKTYHQSTGMFGGAGYDVHAVDNIDLSANRGQTLAIVGESGCGKSTLAKVLTGIELGTEGMVTLSGKEIGQIPVEDREAAVSSARSRWCSRTRTRTLNPSHSIGYVMERAIRRLRGLGSREARAGSRATC